MGEIRQAVVNKAPGYKFTALQLGGVTVADGFTVEDLELEDGAELVAEEDIVLHMQGDNIRHANIPRDMREYSPFTGPLFFDVVVPKKDMESATVAYLKRASGHFHRVEVEDVEFRFNGMILGDGLLSEAGIQDGAKIDFFLQNRLVDIPPPARQYYYYQDVQEH